MKDLFVDGAVNKGRSREKVSKLFDDMEEFSRYSFCLAHAISYSHLTYYTAYLKTHYPSEFFAACISLEEDADKKAKYINDARANGLKVLPPDINLSYNDFSISKNGDILFGFNGIKGLGPAVINKILSCRPFNSFSDFLIKSIIAKGINKKSIEALIYTGALNCFGLSHISMIRSFEKFILDFTNNGKLKEFSEDYIASFIKKEGEYFTQNANDEYSIFNILQKEKELIGVYISGDPFDIIASLVSEDFYPVSQLEERLIAYPNSKCNEYVLCEIVKIKKHQLKNGTTMAFADCKDHLGFTFSLTFFADKWTKFSSFCDEGSYVLAYCSFTNGDRGFSAVILNCIDLSEKIKNSNYTANRSISSISFYIQGTPSTARSKTIYNKLSSYLIENGNSSIDIYFDINNLIFYFKTIKTSNIDIDLIRDLNKIPDTYVSLLSKN